MEGGLRFVRQGARFLALHTRDYLPFDEVRQYDDGTSPIRPNVLGGAGEAAQGSK